VVVDRQGFHVTVTAVTVKCHRT